MNKQLRRVCMALLLALGLTSTGFAQDPQPVKPVPVDQAKPTRLNINKATAADLAALGIDGETAKKVLAKRPFKTMADLAAVLPDGTMAKVKSLIALDDGTVKAVPADVAGQGRGVAEAPARSKVDVNKATAADLAALPGIDAALADKIIAKRPFQSIEALAAVLPARTLARIKPLISVDAASDAGDKPARSADDSVRPKVDVNKATAADLEATTGIDAATAQKIIAGRPYKSVADLAKVLAASDLAKVKPLVLIDGKPVWAGPPLRASFSDSGKLVIVLTAPTSGYELRFDDIQMADGVATVRCTMTAPHDEVTTDALVEHTVEVPSKMPDGATSVTVAVASVDRGVQYLVAPAFLPAFFLRCGTEERR